MAVPNIFANASGSIPLSQLDANFATPVTIGTTQVALGNTTSNLTAVAINSGSVNGSPVGNVTPSTGAFTTVSASGVASFADGTVGAPGITFTSDTDSGIYRIGANNIGIGVNGAKVLDIGTLGVTSPGYLYGIGSVVQVVTGSTTTATSTTSSSYSDTTLTASITPKFNTSKVLVLVMQQMYVTRAADTGIVGYLQLQRNGSALITLGQQGVYAAAVAGVSYIGTYPITYLDSPATTASTTYKTQAAVNPTPAGSQITTQIGSQTSTIILLEIGA